MSLKVIPTGAALGVEISGVDLTKEIDDPTFEQIRQAFYKHEVIIFRDRELSDDDHIRFSARIGKLRRLKAAEGERGRPPEIGIISNIKEGGRNIGNYDAGMYWHTDGAFVKHPHLASLLRAIEVPEKDGRTLGATAYASMTAAYDALSPDMKKRIAGLEAVQSHLLRDEKSGRQDGVRNEQHEKGREAVHPVVRVHPVTGRKCLYVSEGYTARIVGLPEDESRDLLAELTTHCTQPRFVYTHRWRVHDLVMWDDCSTQHKATFDYALPLRRLMHRTTVVGE